MSRRHRLRGRRRFHEVRRRGEECRAGGVRVRALRNEAGLSRAGLAVSGARRAVERNRARRRLRAVLRTVMPGIGAADLIVSVTGQAASADYRDLERDVAAAVSCAARRAGAA